jgi:tetratricopeptide (TPR) repeat protein
LKTAASATFPDYTSVETKSKHKKSHGWNKEDTHQLQQCFSTNCAETDKFKINGKTSTTSSDSTLSLEIEKYENSGGNSDKETTETKKELWKTRNEIPRQQDDNDASKTPEIMPFKKSHKLLNPNQPHSEYKKLIDNANQLYKARRFKDAAKAYSDILSFTRLTSTEKAVVYYNRSTTYMKLISLKNALRQARKDAEKAIELDPTWWKGYYRLATVFIETEKWAESKDLLSKALTLDPTNVTIKDALSTVEYGIFEDSLNYQERRSLHDILNFDNLKISADEEVSHFV